MQLAYHILMLRPCAPTKTSHPANRTILSPQSTDCKSGLQAIGDGQGVIEAARRRQTSGKAADGAVVHRGVNHKAGEGSVKHPEARVLRICGGRLAHGVYF